MESSRNPASSPENTEENRIKLATHICENTSREDLEQFLYEDLLTHYEKNAEAFTEDCERWPSWMK